MADKASPQPSVFPTTVPADDLALVCGPATALDPAAPADPDALVAAQNGAGNAAIRDFLRAVGHHVEALGAREDAALGALDEGFDRLPSSVADALPFEADLAEVTAGGQALHEVQVAQVDVLRSARSKLHLATSEPVPEEAAATLQGWLERLDARVAGGHDAAQERWHTVGKELHDAGLPDSIAVAPWQVGRPGSISVQVQPRGGNALGEPMGEVEIEVVENGVSDDITYWAAMSEASLRQLYGDLEQAVSLARAVDPDPSVADAMDASFARQAFVAFVDERRGFDRAWLVNGLRRRGLADRVEELLGGGDLRMIEEMGLQQRLFEARAAEGPRARDGGVDTTMEDVIGTERLAEIAARAARITADFRRTFDVDPQVLLEALHGLNRYEIDYLRQRCEDDGGRLDAMIQGFLDGDERQAGEAQLAGDHVGAFLETLDGSVDQWTGDDEERVKNLLHGLIALRVKGPEGEMSGLDLLVQRLEADPAARAKFERIAAELTDGEVFDYTGEMLAAAGEGDAAAVRAWHIKDALSGIDRDEEVLKDQTDRDSAAAFAEITGETVEDAVDDEFFVDDEEQTEIVAKSEGNASLARAARIAQVLDAWGSTDDSELLALVSEGVSFGDPSAQQGLQEAFAAAGYGESMFGEADPLAEVLDEHYGGFGDPTETVGDPEGLDPALNRLWNARIVMSEALANRKEPARYVWFGLHGPGKPADALKALRELNRGGITVAITTYARLFAADLRKDVEAVDGDEGLDLRIALEGNDPGPMELRKIVLMVREHGAGDGMAGDGLADLARRYGDQVLAMTEDEANGIGDGLDDGEDRDVRIAFAAFSAVQKTYADAEKEVVDALATGASIAVSSLATFVSGGACAPWLASALGAAASITVKAVVGENRYKQEDLVREGITAAVASAVARADIVSRLKFLEVRFGMAAARNVAAALAENATQEVAGEILDWMGVGGDGRLDLANALGRAIVGAGQDVLSEQAKELITLAVNDQIALANTVGQEILADTLGAAVGGVTKDLVAAAFDPRSFAAIDAGDLLSNAVDAGGKSFLKGVVRHLATDPAEPPWSFLDKFAAKAKLTDAQRVGMAAELAKLQAGGKLEGDALRSVVAERLNMTEADVQAKLAQHEADSREAETQKQADRRYVEVVAHAQGNRAALEAGEAEISLQYGAERLRAARHKHGEQAAEKTAAHRQDAELNIRQRTATEDAARREREVGAQAKADIRAHEAEERERQRNGEPDPFGDPDDRREHR